MGFSNVVHGFSRVVYAATLVKHVVQVVHYSNDLCIKVCVYKYNYKYKYIVQVHSSGSKLLVQLYNVDSVVIQCAVLQCTGTDLGISWQ